MCGRYRLVRKKEILAEIFGLENENEVDWAPRYNVAPGQDVAVIRQDATQPVRTFSLVRWGLIPSWAQDPKVGYTMINARAESIAEKPAFREPLQSRRCLIPADGFYEWAKQGKEKAPYCFTLADDSVFAFAGLWDRWTNPEGEWLQTCSIITTSANPLVAGVHDRMPVILEPENYDLWLDPALKKAEQVIDFLKPYRADAMKSWRVSSRVNSAQNDDPECIEEFVPERSPVQESLFS
jgi:putative SOS response-associated peptidase YedK